MCVTSQSCVVHGSIYGRFMAFYVNGKPLYREKTVYTKNHKTAINRPVDQDRLIFFGLCARKIAFTRQKIRRTVPKVTARVAIFRSAGPKMNVV